MLTSSKSKQSAEKFVDASKHVQFFCFEIWERNRNITKKTIANFSEWVRSAQKPVYFAFVKTMLESFFCKLQILLNHEHIRQDQRAK